MDHNVKDVVDTLSLPCSYSIKIIGRNRNEFHAVVQSILEKHISGGDETIYHMRTSSGSKYMSITATFLARSREQLTGIYEELNKNELVMITL